MVEMIIFAVPNIYMIVQLSAECKILYDIDGHTYAIRNIYRPEIFNLFFRIMAP